MKKNKLRYGCYKCDRRFNSWQARDKHMDLDHQPPKETTVIAPIEEIHNTLLEGSKFEIGDIVYLSQKCVITKITYTENSPDVEVILRITKKRYSREK